MALAEVFEALAGPDAPVEFRAYDGSQAGPAGSAVKIAVRVGLAGAAYLAQAPRKDSAARGELGCQPWLVGRVGLEPTTGGL